MILNWYFKLIWKFLSKSIILYQNKIDTYCKDKNKSKEKGKVKGKKLIKTYPGLLLSSLSLVYRYYDVQVERLKG